MKEYKFNPEDPTVYYGKRIKANEVVQGLFRSVPLESALPDEEIVRNVKLSLPHKTFSRFKIHPPASATLAQRLAIARIVAEQTGYSVDTVLAIARNPNQFKEHALYQLAISNVIKRSDKEIAKTEFRLKESSAKTNHIYLFDRDNSFVNLISEEDSAVEIQSEKIDPEVVLSAITSYVLNQDASIFRYDRSPRVFTILTARSLETRANLFGDTAIERLLNVIETGEQSLNVVDDIRFAEHKLYRGIFAEAKALAILDQKTMIVLPHHGNSIRIYDATAHPEHSTIIKTTIKQFRRLRKFLIHPQNATAVIHLLRHYLSYQLPNW